MNLLQEKFAALSKISELGLENANKLLKKEIFTKDAFLLQEGQIARRLYFIEQGLICGFYYKDHKEVVNWFAAENDFATSMYSFVAQKPGFEYLQALEETTVYSIAYPELQQLFLDFPEFDRFGRVLMEGYYVALEERLISLQFQTAKARYEGLLKNEAHLLQRVTLGKIASYLGITQETLSRIRGK